MRHLLALLDCGTHGTQVEPRRVPRGVHGKSISVQTLTAIGTLGTLGTLETNQAAAFDALAQRLADIADAYAERIAIVLEAGDIGEAEARQIAEAEIGRRFVEMFMAGVVTVSTPAPGVCLVSAGPRRIAEPSASQVSMAPDPERDGARLITAFNGPELYTTHSGLAVSTVQELGDRSTALDCEPSTETSEART